MSTSNEPPQSTNNPPSSATNTDTDTGYVFTNDGWLRFRNTVRYLTGRLTPEGERQYRQGRDDRFEVEDCKRCEEKRDYLLQYS